MVNEIIKQVLKDNTQAVEDYKEGKEQSLNFLVGQVMRETRGAANSIEVINIIKDTLSVEQNDN